MPTSIAHCRLLRELSALLVAVVVVVACTPPTRAAGLLSNVLASHMVLQRVSWPSTSYPQIILIIH
jgi:hypothetical protein